VRIYLLNTLKLTAHTGNDGVLKLEFPTSPNQTFEVVVIFQPIQEETDALGWPIGFFEETYGSLADDPIEITDNLPQPIRD